MEWPRTGPAPSCYRTPPLPLPQRRANPPEAPENSTGDTQPNADRPLCPRRTEPVSAATPQPVFAIHPQHEQNWGCLGHTDPHHNQLF